MPAILFLGLLLYSPAVVVGGAERTVPYSWDILVRRMFFFWFCDYGGPIHPPNSFSP